MGCCCCCLMMIKKKEEKCVYSTKRGDKMMNKYLLLFAYMYNSLHTWGIWWKKKEREHKKCYSCLCKWERLCIDKERIKECVDRGRDWLDQWKCVEKLLV